VRAGIKNLFTPAAPDPTIGHLELVLHHLESGKALGALHSQGHDAVIVGGTVRMKTQMPRQWFTAGSIEARSHQGPAIFLVMHTQNAPGCISLLQQFNLALQNTSQHQLPASALHQATQ
jgi:hypothetical protein